MSQLSKCLKFVTFRGVIFYRIQSFLSPQIDLNFRHLLSCDTIVVVVVVVVVVVKTFIILLIKVSVNIFNVLKSGSTWKACKCAEMFVLWLNR